MKLKLKDKTEFTATRMQFFDYVQISTDSVDKVLEKLMKDNLVDIEFIYDYTTQKAEKLIVNSVTVEKAENDYLVNIYFREQSELEKLKEELEIVNTAVLELGEMAVK